MLLAGCKNTIRFVSVFSVWLLLFASCKKQDAPRATIHYGRHTISLGDDLKKITKVFRMRPDYEANGVKEDLNNYFTPLYMEREGDAEHYGNCSVFASFDKKTHRLVYISFSFRPWEEPTDKTVASFSDKIWFEGFKGRKSVLKTYRAGVYYLISREDAYITYELSNQKFWQ